VEGEEGEEGTTVNHTWKGLKGPNGWRGTVTLALTAVENAAAEGVKEEQEEEGCLRVLWDSTRTNSKNANHKRP
jgi:hypothetical protein